MRDLTLVYSALTAFSLAFSGVASAQATVDEGSFTITRGGERIGREDFVIRRNADVLVASATVTINDHRLSPALQTSAEGAPMRYQVEVRTGNEVQERLSGQIGRGRFSARVKTPRGESAKEYVVSDGALVLDDEVFHQYYFLAKGSHSGAVPVVIPRRNIQVSMRVESRGEERVTIGGTAVAARHLVLTEPDGGARHVWVDGEGRVLKVTLEERGITALRDEPPR